VEKKCFIIVAVLALGLGVGAAGAQEKPAPPLPQFGSVPLKLQIVISRYQGEKKLSNVPYTLSVGANQAGVGPGHTSLRMGAEIPIATTGESRDGKQAPSFQYRPLGTNIDCDASVLDDTHFRVTVTIEDSSVYADDQAGSADLKRAGDHPAFRSFRASESLVLRDGQSLQYTSATDKISGEVIKVDVTLNVIK
jgi:hypothetical protein